MTEAHSTRLSMIRMLTWPYDVLLSQGEYIYIWIPIITTVIQEDIKEKDMKYRSMGPE